MTLRRDARGTAAIEFALALPLFATFLLGLVELGFGAYQGMQAHDAAEAGALYAAENGFSAAGISNAVVSAVGGSSGITASPAPSEFCGCPGAAGVSAIACTATCANGNPPGTYVAVYAAIPHQTILPGLSLPATLTGESIVRIE